MASSWRSYEQYRDALVARHQTALSDHVSVIGDAMLVTSVGLLVAGRFRLAAGTAAAATTVEIAAHLFQPGTVIDEVREVALHPIWAARAEAYRVFRTKHRDIPTVHSSIR